MKHWYLYIFRFENYDECNGENRILKLASRAEIRPISHTYCCNNFWNSIKFYKTWRQLLKRDFGTNFGNLQRWFHPIRISWSTDIFTYIDSENYDECNGENRISKLASRAEIRPISTPTVATIFGMLSNSIKHDVNFQNGLSEQISEIYGADFILLE